MSWYLDTYFFEQRKTSILKHFIGIKTLNTRLFLQHSELNTCARANVEENGAGSVIGHMLSSVSGVISISIQVRCFVAIHNIFVFICNN